MDRKYIVRLFNEFQMYADQVERLEKELNEQSKINDIFDNYWQLFENIHQNKTKKKENKSIQHAQTSYFPYYQ